MKIKPKLDKTKTIWFKPKDWTIRNNKVRKSGKSTEGTHPSLAVGENGKTFANIGLSHDPKRGHHKNIPLKTNPNPKDKKTAYVRTDVEYHNKNKMKEILPFNKLTQTDEKTVLTIINKNKKK